MDVPAVEPTGHRDAVFGLAERDGSVLLVCNPRVDGGRTRDLWDLPGGAVQRGERLPEALEREWREETGLAARVGELLFTVDGVRRTAAGALLYTWRAFAFAVESAGTPRPGSGISAAAWVEREDAIARLDAPYHAHLRAWLAGEQRPYGALTWTAGAEAVLGAPRGMRDLLAVAAASAVGDRALLRMHIAAAVEGGAAPARLVETLLQVVPYAGYPRAITAFGVLRSVLPDAPPGEEEPVDRAASDVRGRATFAAVYGDTAQAVLRGLEALDPVLARWTIEHAYGRVLARTTVLTLLERELLAVAILTALGGLDEPLLGHMRACVRLGAEAAEVAGVIDAVPASAGEGRRAAARDLLQRLTR